MEEMILMLSDVITKPIEGVVNVALQFADAHPVAVLVGVVIIGSMIGIFDKKLEIRVE